MSRADSRNSERKPFFGDLVNVFCGNAASRLPDTGGLAENWFYIKAQSGNTHPYAALPFSMVTAGAYTGGYPCGYGNQCPNYSGRPKTFESEMTIRGFTHFHPTGTGSIGSYYNFFQTVPVPDTPGDPADALAKREKVAEETAKPGYYGVKLENGVSGSMSVGEGYAAHEYRWGTRVGTLLVNFAAGGLLKEFGNGYEETGVEAVELRKISEKECRGSILAEGMRIYAAVICAEAEKLELVSGQPGSPAPDTAVFAVPRSETRVCLGFSAVSEAEAAQKAREGMNLGLRKVYENARAQWEAALGKIEVEESDPEKVRTFYSLLYHSFLKPGRLSGRFYDFATLWDHYKTQFPLIFTLFPDVSEKILGTLAKVGGENGHIPNAILFHKKEESRFDGQAAFLAAYVVCDGISRGVGLGRKKELLQILLKDLYREENAEFLERGTVENITHILDLSDACFYLSNLAEEAGEPGEAAKLRALSENWIHAYDADTGLLKKESEYYEGSLYNYSFRLCHNMEERVVLAKGKEAFAGLLDRFFGLRDRKVKQQMDPNDGKTMEEGIALGRFEGYNNEPDMETPYAYHYAGRYDRVCEIVAEGRKLFSSGKDGIPGNNDSGALSSCYVWNAIGLFPVSGSGRMLLGTPYFRKSVLHLAKGDLVIRAENLSEQNIYVEQVFWNGESVRGCSLPVSELMNGGELEFHMSGRPKGAPC